MGAIHSGLAITEDFATTPASSAAPEASGDAAGQPGAAANTSPAADFYVAPGGNDSWPGTLAQPFATLDRARAAVQALKTQVSNRTITVLLRKGIYSLPSTLNFTAEDSGISATNRVLYANYPGEIPVISGGQPLTGWTVDANGWWELKLPSGTYFSELWVNGTRRYHPSTTVFNYNYVTQPYSSTGSTTTADGFYYQSPSASPIPSSMANLSDVELVFFEAWNVHLLRIKSIDTTQNLIVTTTTMAPSMFQGFLKGRRFLLQNVKEALGRPGRWYLDRSTSTVTYIPLKGETPSNSTVIASRLSKIMTAQNLSHVTFQGITFAYADWQVPKNGYFSVQAASTMPAAMTLSNSSDVIFEASTVQHTGAYGIEFQGTGVPGSASYLAQFKDGMVNDTGAGGIRVGGPAVCSGSGKHTDANVPQYIYIGNNLVTAGGRIEPASQEIAIGDAHHVLVEHNEVSDAYSVGVGVGFNWYYNCNFAHDDVTQFNYIHDLGQGVTDDLGAVYYLTGVNTGNKILNNRVHDIEHDPHLSGYGGWGLYVDAGATQVLIQNNLVYRTTDASFHLNSAGQTPPSPTPGPNVFSNNILAYGAMGLMDRHNDTVFLSLVMKNNIFYYDKGSIQYGYWYCEGSSTCTNYFDLNNNVYYNTSVSGGEPESPFYTTGYAAPNSGQQPSKSYITFNEWMAKGEDTNSLFADPKFMNPTPGVDNYTLQSNSPAFSLGFVAFDPSQAGRLPTNTLSPLFTGPGFPLQPTGINAF